jgi:hypothetical protein
LDCCGCLRCGRGDSCCVPVRTQSIRVYPPVTLLAGVVIAGIAVEDAAEKGAQ